MRYSNYGYQPRTPDEIRTALQEKFKEKVPNFEVRPADLQNNMIDESAVLMTQIESAISILFNGYSPSFAPYFLFQLRGAEQGIRKKGSFSSSVEIQFSGDPSTIIPANTGVTGTGLPTYTIQEDLLIPTSGSVIATAYTDSTTIPPIDIGDLNTITSNIKGLTAENVSTPTSPIDPESNESFTKRVQELSRSPRGGGYDYLLAKLKGIDGVESRSVRVDLSGLPNIEVIIAGGDTAEIAQTILTCGGINPGLYVSNPSGSQTSRTITQNVILNEQSIPYKFTRPLLVNLSVQVNLALTGISGISQAVETITQSAMGDYLNNTTTGEPINIASLNEVFLKAFKSSWGTAKNINSNYISFTINNINNPSSPQPISFSSEGFLQLEKDMYVILSQYKVVINA